MSYLNKLVSLYVRTSFVSYEMSLSLSNFCVYRFPIVEPDPGHTKLRLSQEGLEAIERITNPIASVAVSLTATIKSFCFLNSNFYLMWIYVTLIDVWWIFHDVVFSSYHIE